MASWNDVDRIASSLPAVVRAISGHTGGRAWKVDGKGFAWERPLRKNEIAALGSTAPRGAILGVRTPDLEMKQALLASDPAVFFTTPHFEGYPAVLVRLDEIRVSALRDVVVEAWLTRAPKRLVQTFLARQRR